MLKSDALHDRFSSGLDEFLASYPKDGLYAPIHYLLKIRGKRIRPILALSVCEAEGSTLEEAIPAAVAVELFHNFTLMHDDIMDRAPLRRGQATVHEKFSEDAAILSGDAMFSLALTSLEKAPKNSLIEMLKIFNRTARQVCEGQQLDMEFEEREDVSIDDYLEMIRLKTSVLLACSCAMGAISAGASPDRVELWYRFGEQVGLAFQIQDDLLDTFGNELNTGKKVGGDIVAEKKTFIWLYTKQKGGITSNLLTKLDGPEKIVKVRAAMLEVGAEMAAQKKMNSYADEAISALSKLGLDSKKSLWFEELVSSVTKRTS
ncbi:MAG TPA: polyprenyl synthetase family protein [Flavobacteriales bacterium]|nr:polyprenyl synthetase family protein [Flavobacteriales bacterium]